jgi:Secretion system C-terminal sorting domain
MKRKIPFIYSTFGLLAFAGLFLNDMTGRKGAYSGAPGDQTCANSSCHISNTQSAGGGITLTGAPASFVMGQAYPLTLTLSDAIGVAGGFQIVATNDAAANNVMYGSFSAGAGSKIASTTGASPLRLTHNAPQNFVSGLTSWTFNWVAPATGSGVRFYFAGNASNNDGNETIGDVIYTGNQMGSVPTPVELLNFEGKSMGKSVKLFWQTASERNNSKFEIERNMVGSSEKFEKIGEIKGLLSNFTIKSYDFVDETPHTDNINYYRLRQVDLDGTSTLSKVIGVIAHAANKGFKVYPNFISRGLDMRIETDFTEASTFDIIDLTGRIVKTVRKAENTEGSQISTSDLQAGRYFIRAVGQNVLQTNGFMVF